MEIKKKPGFTGNDGCWQNQNWKICGEKIKN